MRDAGAAGVAGIEAVDGEAGECGKSLIRRTPLELIPRQFRKRSLISASVGMMVIVVSQFCTLTVVGATSRISPSALTPAPRRRPAVSAMKDKQWRAGIPTATAEMLVFSANRFHG
jgi:hypothetical protein